MKQKLEKKFVLYELIREGKTVDFGYASVDRIYANGELNHLTRRGLELAIISDPEGMNEQKAKDRWSDLKARLEDERDH